MTGQVGLDARPSQAVALLALLQEAGPDGVSAIQILRWLGCYRAAARVWELKQQGHNIRTIRQPGRCATYVLETA